MAVAHTACVGLFSWVRSSLMWLETCLTTQQPGTELFARPCYQHCVRSKRRSPDVGRWSRQQVLLKQLDGRKIGCIDDYTCYCAHPLSHCFATASCCYHPYNRGAVGTPPHTILHCLSFRWGNQSLQQHLRLELPVRLGTVLEDDNFDRVPHCAMASGQ